MWIFLESFQNYTLDCILSLQNIIRFALCKFILLIVWIRGNFYRLKKIESQISIRLKHFFYQLLFFFFSAYLSNLAQNFGIL